MTHDSLPSSTPPHTCKCSWKRIGNTCDMFPAGCMGGEVDEAVVKELLRGAASHPGPAASTLTLSNMAAEGHYTDSARMSYSELIFPCFLPKN